MSKEANAQQSRPVELECESISIHVRVIVLAIKMNRWFDLNDTYTKKFDIYETKKLTQGQGHKVKGQGLICKYEKQFWL